MRFDWKRFLFSLLAIAVILVVLYYVRGFLQNEANRSFRLWPGFFWMYFWPIPVAAYFSRSHIKTWFKRGKFCIEFGSLSVAILCLAVAVPVLGFPPFEYLAVRSPCLLPFIALFFWYHLIHAFSCDHVAGVVTGNKRGGKVAIPPFDMDK